MRPGFSFIIPLLLSVGSHALTLQPDARHPVVYMSHAVRRPQLAYAAGFRTPLNKEDAAADMDEDSEAVEKPVAGAIAESRARDDLIAPDCSVHDQYCDNDSDQGLIQEVPELDVYTPPEDEALHDEIPDGLKGGIAYIKVHKVGGSSWGGVMRRIANRHGLNHARDAYWLKHADQEKPSASVWANHGPRRLVQGDVTKVMPNAVYVTLIRDPVNRAMSHFYYSVSNGKRASNDAQKVRFLKGRDPEAQIEYIEPTSLALPHQIASPHHTPRTAHHTGHTTNQSSLTQIMKAYTLVAITERFDESLLILAKKLGLDRSDLLYLKAKEAGKPSTDKHNKGINGILVKHPPFEQESAAVHEAAAHLQSGADAQLHRLASDALDKAILEYGSSFHKDLKELQTMLREVEEKCRPHFAESCLWNDNGCGQDCIDEYVHQRSRTLSFDLEAPDCSMHYNDLIYCYSDSDQGLIQKFPELDVYTPPEEEHQILFDIPHGLRGGIAYIKDHKVGGSTWGGVMRRIGNRHGLNHARDANWLKRAHYDKPSPSVWANESPRRQVEGQVAKVMPNATYIALIRDPVTRAMSQFYWRVSRGDFDAQNDAQKVAMLKKVDPEHQIKYIQPTSLASNENLTDIMKAYTLVALTERFDESLLILAWKLGLDRSDLLYLKAKESGKPATGRMDKKKTANGILAKHPPFEQESAAVHEAAAHLQNGADTQLHRLANDALDKSILEYGSSFHKDLKEFQTMLREVEGKCRPHFAESCLWNDEGCGKDCIDAYLQQRTSSDWAEWKWLVHKLD